MPCSFLCFIYFVWCCIWIYLSLFVIKACIVSVLSIMIFLPIITALFLFIARVHINMIKIVYMIVTFIVMYLALNLYINFDPNASMQLIEYHPWIVEYGIAYHIGVDGVSLGIVMMNAIIMPLVAVALYKQRDHRGYGI